MALTQVQDGMLGYDGGSFANRNRIINGDMRIDQRNAGASVSIPDSAATTFPVDRFGMFDNTSGALDAQQVSSAPVGFVNSLKVTVTTADASVTGSEQCWVRHRIEGFNVADLGWGTAAAKTVTLSFWVRSSLTGTFAGAFQNSAGNRAYPFTYTISSVDTWEQKTVTIAGETSGTWLTTNGVGIQIFWSLGIGPDLQDTAGAWTTSNKRTATGETQVVGTNGATFYITGVQLEVGSVATPFERRPYGTELALCQRYYETTNPVGRLAYMAFNAYNSSAAYNHYPFKVQKRAEPTVTFNGSYWRIYQNNGQLTSTGTATVDGVGVDNVCIVLSGPTFDSTYGQFADNRELNAIKISAEL